MQTITLPLDYDFNVGLYPASTLTVLADLDRLAGPHVMGVPRLDIHCVVTDEDQGTMEFRITTAQLDSDAAPFDWLVDATDSVMPPDASEADITLSFQLSDDQAVLLKAAWPSHYPRLTVMAQE